MVDSSRDLKKPKNLVHVMWSHDCLNSKIVEQLKGPVIMLFGEGLFTVAIRGGQEYKFISPCIALYLG